MTGESVKDENFGETIKKGEGRQCAIKCIDLHVGAAKLGSTVYRLHDSREASGNSDNTTCTYWADSCTTTVHIVHSLKLI